MADDVKRYFSNSEFEKKYGHCRAVAVGDLIFVAGMTGYNAWQFLKAKVNCSPLKRQAAC